MLKKMQTKEARGGAGGEALTGLGEGREENGGEPLEKSLGLELQRREGTLVYLDRFFVNLPRQKFEWGLRGSPTCKSPKPLWCRPPGSRPPVRGQLPVFLESGSRAAADRETPRPAPWDLRGADPLRPQAPWGRCGRGRSRPWGCVSLVTWGLSRLCPAPLASFVLRAVRGDPPGRSGRWGWWWWWGGGSTAEVWEPPGREKLAANRRGCARVSSHRGEQSGGHRAGLHEQTCAPSAPQTKVARGLESGASGPALSPGPRRPSSSSQPPTPSHPALGPS